jgi:hypothetical protein
MPGLGYAYAIYLKLILKSLKRPNYVYPHDIPFVQCVTFWRNKRRLTSLIVGAVFLMTAVPVFAEFKPRDRKPASGYSRAGGSRGCPSSGIPLTQLAPQMTAKTTRLLTMRNLPSSILNHALRNDLLAFWKA